LKKNSAIPWLRQRCFLFKKSVFRSWRTFTYTLSPICLDKQAHTGSGTSEDPYRWVVIEKAPRDWLARMALKLLSEKESSDYPCWRRTCLDVTSVEAVVKHV
jgi:hypothetical protein